MQLPGGGWPTGALTELLLQHSGIDELRLLDPALAKIASRRVVMLEPPHTPQAETFVALGLRSEHTASKI
jgi:protein ImuA